MEELTDRVNKAREKYFDKVLLYLVTGPVMVILLSFLLLAVING